MTELARVRVVFAEFNGGPGVATHYFRKTGVSSWGFYHDTLLSSVLSSYGWTQPLFPEAMTITVQGETDIIDDQTGEILQTLTDDDRAIAGESESGFGPSPSGLVVHWRTNGVVAGKHVRGRTFLVPVSRAQQDDDGTPTVNALADAQEYADYLIGIMSGLVQPVVWSRPKKKPDTDPQEYYRFGSNHDITTASVPNMFAVLRSRRD